MDATPADKLARDLLSRMQTIVHDAEDNLISAKVSQAFQANKSRCLSFPFKVSDHVVLLTAHCRCKFRAGDPNHIAKFMPRFDEPFHIKNTDMKHSTVTLDFPNLPNICIVLALKYVFSSCHSCHPCFTSNSPILRAEITHKNVLFWPLSMYISFSFYFFTHFFFY